MALKKETRVRLGGVEMALAVDERLARRILESAPYRYLVQPAARLLGQNGRVNGHHANGSASGNALGRSATLDPAKFSDPEARAIAERVSAIEWYHVIDLPHGISTPGRADHRRHVGCYGLPEDMRGMRALDVATFDGFWAFEMERRGADVTAVDLGSWREADIPRRKLAEAFTDGENTATGGGFRLARELLGSAVERREHSVYDLTPKEVGKFDLVFMSDLLLHLRDPQRALESVYSVVADKGCAIVAEPYNPDLEGFKDIAISQFVGFRDLVWSIPSTTTLKVMMNVAGFDRVEELSRLRLDYQNPFPVQKVVLKGYPSRSE